METLDSQTLDPQTLDPQTLDPQTRCVLDQIRNPWLETLDPQTLPTQDASVSTSQLQLGRPKASQILESVNGGQDFVGSRQVDHTCMYI